MDRFCPACGARASDEARFCSACGTALPAVEAHTTQPTDELRPVTALFADVVGSTALGERLPPDEVKALIGECVSRMSRAVEEYGGTVQAYMGDGICAYFGVPAAHEDDPERAARAALRILEVIGEYTSDIAQAWGIGDFNVRVGINSGQTAVGLVGAADRQAVALGDSTNVAARLQSAAHPGEIAVGEGTARRLAHRFALEPLGDVTVKGRDGAVSAWRLLRSKAVDWAAPPAHVLIGREAEMARLEGGLAELEAGRGQAVLLSGDAGIGKTRLMDELQEVAGDRVIWLEGHCLSYGGLLCWPFVEILRNWLGVQQGEPEIAVRTKARAKLGAAMGADLIDVLPALGRFVRIRLEPELAERDAGVPQEVALRRAYSRWIETLAASRPVVVAIDDVHWADHATRELCESLLDLTDQVPLLLLTTFRPDPTSEGARLRLKILAEYGHRASELQLGPLSEAASRELLAQSMPAGLDDATRDEIVARAEGNPLYLEELAKVLAEGGSLDMHRTWTTTLVAVSSLSPALQALLVSRIDLLSAGARRLVQIAAVIGRSFPVRVLERVAGGQIDRDLTSLLRAEIVRELRRYPEAEYTFRHGLFQQAALSTLTRPRRAELHARIAAAYEELYAGALDDYLERLAHHHAQSRNLAAALAYLELAGSNAAAVDDRAQATELWQRALVVAERLGDGEARARLAGRVAEAEAPA